MRFSASLKRCPDTNLRRPNAECQKQMRPGPATRAALLSRDSGCRLSSGTKEHRVPALVRAHNPRCSPEALASGFQFSASILPLEGRISSEAATPGHQFTVMNRTSPGDHPHGITGNAETGSAELQNVRALTAQ